MRNCIICKHWWFSNGQPDYSDYTPGESWSAGCYEGNMTWDLVKGKSSIKTYDIQPTWQIEGDFDDDDDCPITIKDKWKNAISIANVCEYFSNRPS